jgi:hypothetical protein
MSLNLDRMLYLVISDHKDGPIIWEIQLHRMDLVQVTKDIMHGQYDGEVLAVIEMNPEEGICREVTSDFETLLPDRDADRT